MAFIERFSKIVKGDLLFVGNTLGLSKDVDKNTAGVLGSIGAFSSLNQNEQVATFPKGTTLDYLKNGSFAVLNIPKGSEILYAELVWSGVYKANEINISKDLAKPISFTTPKGQYDINAEYKTKQDLKVTIGNLNLGVYVKTCNVTDYVIRGMSGRYSVEKVPSIIEPLDDKTKKTNFAGWTLIVAYKNDNLKPKNLSINVGGEVIYNNKAYTDINLKGFNIPLNDFNYARLFLSSGEGDAELFGDKAYFGDSINNLIALSGNNNPENNFFCSQINDKNGDLNNLGTFGTYNHNALDAKNTNAGRQGWDITSIDLIDKIKADFLNSTLRFESKGDLFFPNAIGLAVDSKGANLKVTKTSDKQTVIWGDLITYTITIENIGDVLAEDVVLFDSVPKCLEFLQHSIKVNGNSYSGTFPIVLNNLNPKEKNIVTFKTRVKNKQTKLVKNNANVTYNYLVNGLKVKENTNSNLVCLRPDEQNEKVEITKEVDKKNANSGDILTYTNTIKNVGDVDLKNIVFYDFIPNGTKFVAESIFVDGKNFIEYTPEAGFIIESLAVGKTTKIEFKVIVL